VGAGTKKASLSTEALDTFCPVALMSFEALIIKYSQKRTLSRIVN
jgi:hypothetical protein